MFEYLFHGIQIRSGISLEVTAPKSIPQLKPLHRLHVFETGLDPYPLTEPLWEDPYHFPDGTPVARLFIKGGKRIMETPNTGTFLLEKESIAYFRKGDAPSPVPYLLGRVFALYLELAGLPLLHGCCFSYGAGAAGLLGDSGAGKSTLGAALVARGIRLLTDDLIPLHLEGNTAVIYPGIPMSRIWPDTGAQFVPNFDLAPKIHPLGKKKMVFDDGHGGPRFADSPAPLRHLFVLCRHSAAQEISLETITGASALMELVRLSYRPELVQTLGIQPLRMQIMARALTQLTLHKLTYPTGFQHVNDVCTRILQATTADQVTI